MHNIFDYVGKGIGSEALGACGLTVIQDELVPDACHADLRHEPDPARGAERERLGLLGRIAAVLCLIEIYSGAPGEDDALACVAKLIAFRQRQRRDAKKKGKAFVRPFVWIITARRPTGVLAALDPRRAAGWPRGVYFGRGVLCDAGRAPLAGLDGAGGLFRVGIVVASELPRRRSTILVRLMAGGPLLRGALADLGALPEDAYEHAMASPILLGLGNVLAGLPERTAEEKEFIVDLKAIGMRLLDEHRMEGQLVGVRLALRRVLAARKLTPNRADAARIERCTDIATLERWIDLASTAKTAGEALRVNAAGATRRAAPRRGRSTTSARQSAQIP
jgi:hypothetical protein